MNADCRIHLLTQHDLEGAHRLSKAAGWNQTLQDWRRAILYQPDGCFAAMCDDRLVGTVTTTSYGTALAWIGMMLVDDEYRRQGIGRALMRRAIDFLQDTGVVSIRLDATPAGRPLYEQLGFVAEWTFHRWQGIGPAAIVNAGQSDASSDDEDTADRPTENLFAVPEFDLEAFGCDRSAWLAATAKDALHLVQQDDGFGLLRAGERADYLGPVAAVSDVVGTSIVTSLLNRSQRPVFWDIPAGNEHSLMLATALGFQPARELTRMRLGPETVQPDYARQFAICDPGMG